MGLTSVSVDLSVNYQNPKLGLTKDETFTTRLLGIIGQSHKPLGANEIKKNMQRFYPGSDCRFVYQKLRELTPTEDEIPGIRLFCYDDFIENNSTGKDHAYNKKLMKKLETSYGYTLKWEWDKIKPYYEISADGSKIVKMEQSPQNLIQFELLPRGTNQSDNRLVKMVFIKNGSKFEPPLIIKRKNTKVYVYSMSIKTYFKDRRFRTYLKYEPNRKTQQIISEKFARIEKSNFQQNESEQTLRQEIAYLYRNREFWEYSLNLRGLLRYLVGESIENNRIDKTLETLSELDKYTTIRDEEHIDEDVDEDENEYGHEKLRIWDYSIKENLPFLSSYNKIKKVLPEKFAANLLKRIALELLNRMEDSTIENLRYEVTEKYYDSLADHFWTKDIFVLLPKILGRAEIDLGTRRTVIGYQLEILMYLNHKRQKEMLSSEREYRRYLDYHNYTNLQIELENIVDTSDGKDVICIDNTVRKFRVPYHLLKEIMEIAEYRYKEKYTIVELCFIPNSKIDALKTALGSRIRYKDACLVFTNKGIPASCHGALIPKLGYSFDRIKDYNFSNPFITKINR